MINIHSDIRPIHIIALVINISPTIKIIIFLKLELNVIEKIKILISIAQREILSATPPNPAIKPINGNQE